MDTRTGWTHELECGHVTNSWLHFQSVWCTSCNKWERVVDSWQHTLTVGDMGEVSRDEYMA